MQKVKLSRNETKHSPKLQENMNCVIVEVKVHTPEVANEKSLELYSNYKVHSFILTFVLNMFYWYPNK